MKSRVVKGIGLVSLTIGFVVLTVIHGTMVQIDYDICFDNYASSVNNGPYGVRLGEMPIGTIVSIVAREILTKDNLLLATFAFLPTLPFLIAWGFSRQSAMHRFWVVSAFSAVVIVVFKICIAPLSDFYDCDRNGVGLGIVAAPIVFALINLAFVVGVSSIYAFARFAERF